MPITEDNCVYYPLESVKSKHVVMYGPSKSGMEMDKRWKARRK